MHRPEPNFNVAAQVIKQAEQNPSNTATIFEGKTTTYGEFASRVRAQARLLRVFAEKSWRVISFPYACMWLMHFHVIPPGKY